MFGLLVSLFVLGIVSVDPIGIAIMPIILTQKNPIARSLAFLLGSFSSFMVIGYLFSRYIGRFILRFEHHHLQLTYTLEAVVGVLLILFAIFVIIKAKKQPIHAAPPKGVVKHLQLRLIWIYLIGAGLVAFQSVVDIVFLMAMIRINQLHLTTVGLSFAIAVYALSSLLLQFLIIVAFAITPLHHRHRTLSLVERLLNNYANHIIIFVSLGLGLILIALSLIH